MLHKGFCSTFQYPCSFIFFILYRFIFTPFLLIRNPPLQLTNSSKMDFSKASPVQKPSTHQSSLLGGSSCAALRQTTFQIFLRVHQHTNCSTLFQPFSGFNKHKISTLFKPASGLITKFQPLFKSFSGFISDFLHFIKHKFSTLFIKNCLHYKEALRPPLHWLALL